MARPLPYSDKRLRGGFLDSVCHCLIIPGPCAVGLAMLGSRFLACLLVIEWLLACALTVRVGMSVGYECWTLAARVVEYVLPG